MVVQLQVTPQQALVDIPVEIVCSGCQPGQMVTLRTKAQDSNQQSWDGYATYQADEQGEVRPGLQEALSGTYRGVDAMGLFWSMQVKRKRHIPPTFVWRDEEPLHVQLTAEIASQTVAQADIERVFVSPDVEKVILSEQGLVGTLYHPKAAECYPGVLILSGSDGSLRPNQAAVLASHGYAALSLVYFNAPGLPNTLANIPLEYFEKAIAWLQAQPFVNAEKIGVIGLSRGGELSLLLGAMFPAIKAVVAGSPSGITHAGLGRNVATWTYHDEPFPYPRPRFTFWSWLSWMTNWLKGRAFELKSIFMLSLQDQENVARATIPVEKTRGPILLISGDEDQMWPASLFSEMVVQRLREQQFPYAYEHLLYAGAGHFVCFPYGYPHFPPAYLPQNGMAFGGSAAANAVALKDSWEKILAFFAQNL
ncbi:acyl-CoA thioesterase/bile acid-CoA:amino acid N-acyltransferase family protein [Dictyobacter formicarum]|uniref:Acyl-CoA thioesterase n=1 Tax=Dictyobacter formicarum TaxID=2778368 RepID=A0ABQ3VD55_9CHLR|nr:acyl-CoA thioesterase/bile acid-CoA:amino acid N-acyltransferase family protein [Dictyobacter formicarum]GHO83719.1 acyl-CoA thioesterase [Dictyobacter formicarum]